MSTLPARRRAAPSRHLRDLVDDASAPGAEYSKIWDLFAFQPRSSLHLARFTQGVLRQPATISPGLRELIAAYTSYQNECRFCTLAHAAAASELLGDETLVWTALRTSSTARSTTRQGAAALRRQGHHRSAGRLARRRRALRAAGWDDEAIYFAITTCALFNFYNRWITRDRRSRDVAERSRQQGQGLPRAATSATDRGTTMPHIPLPDGLPGIRGPMAFRPETAKPLNELVDVLLRGPHSLSPGERELIATYVSSRERVPLLPTVHGAFAASTTAATRRSCSRSADPEQAAISDKLKALLDIAGKVAESGKLVTADDVARARQGATDLEIHDTVLIAAALLSLQPLRRRPRHRLPDSPDYYRERAPLVAQAGYQMPPRRPRLGP